jgi:hypothetical protein
MLQNDHRDPIPISLAIGKGGRASLAGVLVRFAKASAATSEGSSRLQPSPRSCRRARRRDLPIARPWSPRRHSILLPFMDLTGYRQRESAVMTARQVRPISELPLQQGLQADPAWAAQFPLRASMIDNLPLYRPFLRVSMRPAPKVGSHGPRAVTSRRATGPASGSPAAIPEGHWPGGKRQLARLLRRAGVRSSGDSAARSGPGDRCLALNERARTLSNLAT